MERTLSNHVEIAHGTIAHDTPDYPEAVEAVVKQVSPEEEREKLRRRDELFHQYLPLAHKIARRRHLDMPRSVSYDEILSAAHGGLLDAATKFDDRIQMSFQIYARFRILGAIDDYLRTCTWGGRNRRLQKWSLEVNVGNGSGSSFSSLQDSLSKDEGESNAETEDFFAYVTSSAPPMVRKMFKMYFVDGITMKEIGVSFHLSEARVSQLLTEYKRVIQGAWKGREHELWGDLSRDRPKVHRLTRDVAARRRPVTGGAARGGE